MLQFDLVKFLKGEHAFGFSEEISETQMINLMDSKGEVEDYGEKGKYIHYGDLRFFFVNGKLKGIDLFLINSNESYECHTLEGNTFVDKNCSLLKVLGLLNQLDLKWNIQSEKSKFDYLMLEIISGINIFFYYETEQIERISYFFQQSAQ